ncbi:MAG: GTPase ObgE [Deltaproteobacteria bacterium]|nr:GTPase ObgE [Deltaproteobacteria bacterium]
MQFVDYVKINIRSGSGGNGCSSFRREKFIPRGGPDGGNGGDGGDVYFLGTTRRTSLLDFHYHRHYRAPDGTGGKGKDMHGRSGEVLLIEVPFGTIVRDAESGDVLLEVLDETPLLCLRGGRGGRGNTTFKSSTNRTPEECTPGEPGEEKWVELELKLMADVGLVGFPNAGKSTLISRISKARPKIADYPFTTLTPQLGVVRATGYETFVVADIPGIIKGAHEGHGLGHRFLRHIERTAMLLLLLDCAQEPDEVVLQYETLLDELGLHEAALLEKRRLVAITKTDASPDPEHLKDLVQRLEKRGEQVFPISAVAGRGLDELIAVLGREVKRLREETGGGGTG